MKERNLFFRKHLVLKVLEQIKLKISLTYSRLHTNKLLKKTMMNIKNVLISKFTIKMTSMLEYS